MPESPFAQPDAVGAGPDTSQLEVGAGVRLGAPPSMRVRTLSCQFSERTQQQSQIARSVASRQKLTISLSPCMCLCSLLSCCVYVVCSHARILFSHLHCCTFQIAGQLCSVLHVKHSWQLQTHPQKDITNFAALLNGACYTVNRQYTPSKWLALVGTMVGLTLVWTSCI